MTELEGLCRTHNLKEDLEDLQDPKVKDSHSANATRINRIYLQQPAIRAALGCQPSKVARYCDSFHREPQLTSSPPDSAKRTTK